MRGCGCWLDPVVWGHSCTWPEHVLDVREAERILRLMAVNPVSAGGLR